MDWLAAFLGLLITVMFLSAFVSTKLFKIVTVISIISALAATGIFFALQ